MVAPVVRFPPPSLLSECTCSDLPLPCPCSRRLDELVERVCECECACDAALELDAPDLPDFAPMVCVTDGAHVGGVSQLMSLFHFLLPLPVPVDCVCFVDLVLSDRADLADCSLCEIECDSDIAYASAAAWYCASVSACSWLASRTTGLAKLPLPSTAPQTALWPLMLPPCTPDDPEPLK